MFLSCGDALFDLFVADGGNIDPLSTGITVSGNVGGSPINVAVGLARMGHQSSYFTKLSSDAFGVRMRQYLKTNDLQTELCIDTQLNTTLAIVETNADGSANYVFYTDNTADVSIEVAELPATLPGDIKVLHFGSYSTAVDPTGSSLLALAKRERQNRFISYDPNLRLSIEPDTQKWREVFDGYAGTATMIKASDEDIEALFGKDAEAQFVESCFKHGGQLVFITRGPDGSSGFLPDGTQATVAGKAVDVVDTVGAGDTFQAAMLHYLTVKDHISDSGDIVGDVDLSVAVEFATAAASVTCTRSGADLPRLADLPPL